MKLGVYCLVLMCQRVHACIRTQVMFEIHLEIALNLRDAKEQQLQRPLGPADDTGHLLVPNLALIAV